ncbi:MAG: hypothetical protein ACKVI3_20535, partial [Verrucomicrobiia bacterium]|jgi:hypothetical protein|tara:strand:- start:3281 stop:3838 length:558 start_codon:yes stop_codon:yes gene_type:complete
MRRLLILPLLALSCFAQVIDIASRRELFVDHYLIDRMDGAELRLQVPQDRGIAFPFDLPHKGAFCGYTSMITLPDGGGFRAYYRGLPEAGNDERAMEIAAYAESEDGIHWTKPENNIVLRDAAPATHNFTVYYDLKPGVPDDEKWKGIGGLGTSGLIRYVSADGIKWRILSTPLRIKSEQLYRTK